MNRIDTSTIVEKVLQASRDGKIDWKVSVATPVGGYIATLGETLVHCYRLAGFSYFDVLDKTGKKLVEADTVRSAVLLEEIVELARRKALKVDERLNDLNRALDDL